MAFEARLMITERPQPCLVRPPRPSRPILDTGRRQVLGMTSD